MTEKTLYVSVSESDLAFLMAWAKDGIRTDTIDPVGATQSFHEVAQRIDKARQERNARG